MTSAIRSSLLGPRPGLVNDREIARCVRHNREPLNLIAAAVLHRALTCSREDRARDGLSSPAEHTAAQRLIAAGLLETRPGLLHCREIARCLRHTRQPLELAAAAVLHRPREDRARGVLSTPAEHAAADRLIAAGLLEDDQGFVRPTPRAEATFQAALDPRYLRWTT